MSGATLATALGGRKAGAGWTAPCPAHDDRTPSLSIRDGDDGKVLIHCFAGCNSRAVIAALRTRGHWGERDASDPPRRLPSPTRAAVPKPQDAGYIHSLWRQTRPAPGTTVDLRLRACGIKGGIPASIRSHPALPYHDDGRVIGTWPAMITRLDDAAGNLVGLQRTWLDGTITPDPVGKTQLPGGLPARKTLGSQGVAWLGRRDASAIIVAEGVETALAASEFGDESWPSWGLTPVAAISAVGLGKFVIPSHVHQLFLAEDDDEAGRRATATLAARARAAGVKVGILRVEPPAEVA